ncbi:MAG: DUF2889 domain-containing protein [Alphaproteobacteria bacterium]|nr:DUF2889 domain-containing protein [Alphaproteobacteria bacterium]
MPLSPPQPREHIHTRDVTCAGYRREDGLWDIEGHLTDTKTYAFGNEERGEVAPGVPVHEMWIRLTVTDTMEIKEVEAATDFSPFSICREVAPNFQRLIGLRIGPGWRKKVLAQVGGVEGCTHIVELLGPVATTAYQTIMPIKNREQPDTGKVSNKAPRLLNTCHAFRSDGPKTKEFWPEFYDGPEV